MTEGPRQGLINHLIDLEFPDASNDEKCGVYTGSLPVYHDSDEAIYRIQDCRRAIKQFDEELQSLPTAELEQRYAELEPNIKRAEQMRFFNQPYANADYAHWCKAAGWSIDEATALSFGKAPEQVKWESVEQYALFSPFAKQYMRIRHLVQRAEEMKQLLDPMEPGFFLAWAKRNEIRYPRELEKQVKACGHVVADWKSRNDEIKDQFERYKKSAESEASKKEDKITKLIQERADLVESIAELEQLSNEKSFSTKEHQSLLKLFGGVTAAQYPYDPEARTPAVSQIVEDLRAVKIKMDGGTVRKYLKLASKYVRFNDDNQR